LFSKENNQNIRSVQAQTIMFYLVIASFGFGFGFGFNSTCTTRKMDIANKQTFKKKTTTTTTTQKAHSFKQKTK
jgi:hypothetical protein